jgi:hypothetical protein
MWYFLKLKLVEKLGNYLLCSAMAELIGSMVCQPVLFYDWVIPDFLNWVNAKSSEDSMIGPNFIIQNKRFFFAGMLNALPQSTVRIWLGKRSQDPICLSHFSLSLVKDDGSEKEICSKTNVTFTASFLDDSKEDGKFNKGSLEGFLSNGKLRIRSRIKIGYQEKTTKLKTDVSAQENSQTNVASLIVDLSLQFSEQTLSFTDTVLVCDNKELMVHRFMLATRSPVFKAMFSHEESSDNHGRKVSSLFVLKHINNIIQ